MSGTLIFLLLLTICTNRAEIKIVTIKLINLLFLLFSQVNTRINSSIKIIDIFFTNINLFYPTISIVLDREYILNIK